jgi:low temperature requirement protein LtrA
MGLVRAPRLRYVAGSPARRVTWLELFFDLIFVAAVSQVGAPLREDFTAGGLLRFAVLFVPIWWAWTGQAVFSTRFDTDDGVQRALTLLQMFAVAAMAANAKDALDSRSSAGFAAAYAAVRFILVAQYCRARAIDRARALAIRYLAGHGAAALLWLVSAIAPPPWRFVMWAAALALDLGTPWIAERHSVAVPPDAAHLPERFGLFTIVLLGESVVAVMHGMESQERWTPPAAAAAFLGMAMAFAIWWWYFDGVAGGAEQHVRSGRDAVRFHLWSYAHLPLYLGIAVAAAGIERIVHAGAVEVHGTDAAILSLSIAFTMAALTAIGATGARRHGDRQPLVPQVLVVALTLALAFSGLHLAPLALVVLLTALCAAQLAFSLRVAHAPAAPVLNETSGMTPALQPRQS